MSSVLGLDIRMMPVLSVWSLGGQPEESLCSGLLEAAFLLVHLKS